MTNNGAGVYVHIPFCHSRCAYCSFVSSVGGVNVDSYVATLIREIRERVHGIIDSVFVGGGTPSVLPHGRLTEIFGALRSVSSFSPDCEITTEANPESCTPAFLDEACACGVNRLSLGVQSLNDTVLVRIGRRHTAAQAFAAIEQAQAHGLKNVNADLIVGLPEQTEQDIRYAVNALCERGVTHMSVYALSVEENTPLYDSGYRTDDDTAADLYETAYACLRSHGMQRYEVSNFCFPGYRCKHNFGYWTRKPYFGVGAAAHSFSGTVRSYNTSDIAQYVAGNRAERFESINAAEALEEYVMLGLRTVDGIAFSELNRLSGTDWKKSREKALNRLSTDGLIHFTENGIALAEKAYFVMNDVIVRLI